jgi:hypothetical protein
MPLFGPFLTSKPSKWTDDESVTMTSPFAVVPRPSMTGLSFG